MLNLDHPQVKVDPQPREPSNAPATKVSYFYYF